MAYNWDTLGMMPRAERASAWHINMQDYAVVVEWLRRFLLETQEITLVRVVHDPPANVWRCYDASGCVVANVPQDLMERVLIVLRRHDQEDQA